ncbi:MAG: type IV secretory system conjugative DNA transfer family protein [Candidatus Falkowbacteria bacterium]|nr:type IV secretory system conjugative DNA transfer family protein [Candidatus Falkowbacteria bacterium]
MDYGLPTQTNNLSQSQVSLILNFNSWLFLILAIFGIITVSLILLRVIRYYIGKKEYLKYSIFLILLPKDRSPDEKKEFNVQELHEEISKAETIFSSIGGLRAERGIKAFFFGRKDNFTFEIVASNKKISFYVASPKKFSSYIEQQILAHYPDAVIEEAHDYNIFSPNSEVVGAILKTKRIDAFPIKTYKKHETDPMNSIINVLTKLNDNEGLAIQYCVRSAKASWHRHSSDLVRKAHKHNSMDKALNSYGILKGLSFFGDLIEIANPNPKDSLAKTETLTAMESEILKGIEEKNSKAGLDVNLRIVVSANTKEQASAYLENITNAYSQYNSYEYGNSFPSKPKTRFQKSLIYDFIHRRFNERYRFLLNTEEMASLYHFPLKNTETPNIEWLTAKLSAAPTNVPTEGILLGHNVYRGVIRPIQILPADRLRHMYIIGKSGGGKSKFIANMAVQDILNGDGVCVIDPHGDLMEEVLTRVPPERAEDVIIFSPSDLERPLGLNLLEFDERYPEQKTFAINEMIGIMDKLYDLKSTGGPMFELYMRNAMLLVMSDPTTGSTLMEIPKVLANASFRKAKLDRCKDQTVVSFWKEEAEKAGGEAALENIVPYITSKLTQFISNDTMRPIIAQQKSAFNFRDIMDSQKILLVKLSKGSIGEMNAYLLGMIIVGKILMAALSRADMLEKNRKPFYLYVDEFQNFTTNSIAQILSEARKYGLGLTVAHQYIGQLTKNNDTTIKDAVFGNVGTMIAMRIGAEDADFLEKEFAPVFSQFDLLNVPMFTSYIKLLINQSASKPFSMKNPFPLAGVANEYLAENIKSLSRLKYGEHRDRVEAEILRRVSS